VVFIVAIQRKSDCLVCQTGASVLVIEFLSRFFVNLFLGVLQVIVVACFNL
jgi:hypothetical protein